MSGERYDITEVRFEWSDMGVSHWTVFFTNNLDDTKWCLRVQGNDELDAFVEAIRILEGAK